MTGNCYSGSNHATLLKIWASDLSLYIQLSASFSYSKTTSAPRPFIRFCILSASSFGSPSFSILGAFSTNFFESTKLRPSMLLTSLIILGLEAGSNLISFTLNIVFSSTGSAAASSTGAAWAAEAAVVAGAAKEANAVSGILRRDWRELVPLR